MDQNTLTGQKLTAGICKSFCRPGYDNEGSKTNRLTLPARRRAIDVVAGSLSF